tara:strand:+ start:965 stop:1756 length:792 start_codon:yes stop_codon:yes gene_type:complete
MAELEVSIEKGVCTLTMNRPEVRNALGDEMRTMLRETFHQIENDSSVRAVLLRGAGDTFMAGGDVKGMASRMDRESVELRDYYINRINQLVPLLSAMRRLPKPIVASVAGAAAGAGVSLALACDLVIAADDAFFMLSHANVGTSPDGGATFQLPRAVGIKRAMEITLLGGKVEAEQAASMGLINFVVPPDELESRTQKLVSKLARGPTRAYGRAKTLLYRSIETQFESQLLAEAESFADCSIEPDFREGVTAFMEKRRPNFTG